MSFAFMIRDAYRPRDFVLNELNFQPGFQVLDFGCGPGTYSILAAQRVGESGNIYALDINPLAIQSVQHKATQKRLTNIKTIQSDCKTGLPDESIDIVLLYDTFHHLNESETVLKELHRILKRNGVLSVSDHHLQETEIVNGISHSGNFALTQKGKWTFQFTKVESC
ncbi:class I SAM-dependent methyltransferase [candidate division KSB1 bacterium]|nr:class I SAM-dependent methyltransferase [candidate division KSB1 bacterium]